MSASDASITPDDITSLNRAAMDRTATLARTAGTVLLVVGLAGAVAWLWLAVRQQQLVDGAEASPFGEETDASFQDRVDALVNTIGYLLTAALTAGLGVGLRVVADYSVVRTGGSLTLYEVGDPITEPPEGETRAEADEPEG